MKKIFLYSLLSIVLAGFWFGWISMAETVDRIDISSNTTSVEPWLLPDFSVTSSNDYVSFIDMNNSNWSYTSNGAWIWFWWQTPIAVNDGKKHYWMGLAVNLKDGYTFGDDVSIYFNGNDVTNQWYTKMWLTYSWWGYVTIDLWTAWEDLSRTITYDANGWNWTMSPRKVYVWDEIHFSKCTFTPPTWKVFKAWEVNGKEYGVVDNYTVTDNVTVKALWKDDVYIRESRATMSPSTLNSNISANDLVFTSTEPSKYTVKLWRVFDKTDTSLNTSSSKEYPHSSKFIAGHEYLIEFIFSAVAPYEYDEIDSSLCWPFYLNDKKTDMSAATALSCSPYRWLLFTAEWGKLTVSAETKVPNAWDSAYDYMYEYKPTISTNNINYNAHDWYDEKGERLTSFDKFETWKTYTLKIRATSTSENFNSNTEATINGNKAKILDYSNWLLFSYDFSLATKQWTVTFNLNGGTMSPISVSVNNGEKVAKPSKDPTKDGYSFGWRYSNSTLTKSFDFDTTINSDTIIYAKRIKNKETVTSIQTKVTAPTDWVKVSTLKPTISTSDVSLYAYDWYDDNDTKLSSSDKFEAGNTYRLKVRASTSTKQFTNETKPTINDKNTTVVSFDAQTILYYYDFTIAKEGNYTVTFDLDWGKMSSPSSVSVKDWEKVSKPSKDPTKDDYKFEGWYSNSKLTKEFDFDSKITENTTIYAKWTSTKTEVKENENKDKEEIKDTEKKEEVKENNNSENNNEVESNGEKKVYNNGFSEEFNEAYEFAFKNGITTMDAIEKADMNWGLTRIAMAKMLSQYAINILGKTPDTSKTPSFKDVSAQLDADYNNWVTLAYQLWIMWIWIDKFRPYDWVTRSEFATALSRMLYGLADGNPYYSTHLAKLKAEWIISNDDPNLKEVRWYVMIMLMRSAK